METRKKHYADRQTCRQHDRRADGSRTAQQQQKQKNQKKSMQPNFQTTPTRSYCHKISRAAGNCKDRQTLSSQEKLLNICLEFSYVFWDLGM